MIRAAVLGTGYVGGELIRILSQHPRVELVEVQGRTSVGKQLGSIFPNLDLHLKVDPLDASVGSRADVVFTALPHATSMRYVPQLLAGGCKVVDLSADFRLPPEIFERVYGVRHECPELRGVYGLPELHEAEIKKARLVANPGCYPTPAVLALAPLARERMIQGPVVIDAMSGSSGAGHTPSERTHHPVCGSNVQVYATTFHRHKPEIEQELEKLSGQGVRVHFTAHLLPIVRGILQTIHVFLKSEADRKELLHLYREFYRGKKFVRLKEGPPQLKEVIGSNYCDIGLEACGNCVVLVAVVDNLIKGAAGQAVQNMNLMFGLPEDEGLKCTPLWP